MENVEKRRLDFDNGDPSLLILCFSGDPNDQKPVDMQGICG